MVFLNVLVIRNKRIAESAGRNYERIESILPSTISYALSVIKLLLAAYRDNPLPVVCALHLFDFGVVLYILVDPKIARVIFKILMDTSLGNEPRCVFWIGEVFVCHHGSYGVVVKISVTR